MKHLKTKEEISSLIDEFAIYMPRLFQKVESLDSYTSKLEQNAIVLVDCDVFDNKGFVIIYANDSVNHIGFISLIVVKDTYKQSGIGKALIQNANTVMKQNGMKTVRLEVDKCNTNAIGFYHHLGFSIKEERASSFIMDMQL